MGNEGPKGGGQTMNGRQMYIAPIPYWEKEEGGKKKRPAATSAQQQQAARPKQRVVENAKPGVRLMRSDCGSAYLAVPAAGAAAANSGSAQQMFAEPVPYHATD